MELIGNNQEPAGMEREESGNLPAIRDQKDALVLRLRLEGRTYQEMSDASGVPVKTLQNSFAKGGRLEPFYRQILRTAQKGVSESVEEAVKLAKQEAKPAMERQIELSKTAENEAALFKANEYVLGVAGVSNDPSFLGVLRTLTYEAAKKKMDEAFMTVFGRPCVDKKGPDIYLSDEEARRMEEAIKYVETRDRETFNRK